MPYDMVVFTVCYIVECIRVTVRWQLLNCMTRLFSCVDLRSTRRYLALGTVSLIAL